MVDEKEAPLAKDAREEEDVRGLSSAIGSRDLPVVRYEVHLGDDGDGMCQMQ